jgi:hypothetical protein
MINITFKNNTIIRLIAIELVNKILILVFLMIKSLLKKPMVCLHNFSTLFSVLSRKMSKNSGLHYSLGVAEYLVLLLTISVIKETKYI